VLRKRPKESAERKRRSTHAWAELCVPGAGWITFDPTNRSVGGFNLIPVAVVRDICQAIPVSGDFVGTADAFAGVSVEVPVRSCFTEASAQAHFAGPTARLVSRSSLEICFAPAVLPGTPERNTARMVATTAKLRASPSPWTARRWYPASTASQCSKAPPAALGHRRGAYASAPTRMARRRSGTLGR
jgi:hypothetical protein